MPKKKQPDNSVGNESAPSIYQTQGSDPTIWDLDTAIQPWTVLVNQALPDVYNSLNYLRGIIDGL